ncbi:phage virion morphogenesis protein [Camelimonas lactis]|uniref:Phage gpG-like protein n=1 Tax=Camelimonas lactis TaxID=659006 RepID=A0A4R2GW15_9HYPH|nr:phage virion morphogenesis protein [Camelimonas lactis]TCO15191.1 phage gpG-like protein [Camelimonas lactis]
MIIPITIKFDPDSPGFLQFEKLTGKIETIAPGLLKNIGDALLATTADRFDSQTAPDGSKWAPLKPLTVMIRGSATPILRVSGELKDSVTRQVEGWSLRIGPNKVYAAAQQFGATIEGSPLRIPLGKAAKGPAGNKRGAVFVQSVTLTPRPYIGVGPEDERAIQETSEDWFALDG